VVMTKREWIGGLPPHMASLPLDHRGFPVPFFVAWQHGKPLFPVMDPAKMQQAHRRDLCWVCGKKNFAFKCFVIGPMCCINEINSEPPSHYQCARFSALNCPFLSKPKMRRVTSTNEAGEIVYQDEVMGQPAGMMVERNPGVTCVWVTRSSSVFDAGGGGVLWKLGPPVRTEFYANGRLATRDEVEESVRTGLPILEEAARKDGPGAPEAMQETVARFRKMIDQHPQWRAAA
jgi:hypothetical protein